MKKIPLTQGQFALVADQHYEDLVQFKWYAIWSHCTHSFYAMRHIYVNGKRTSEWMHRRILGLKMGDRRQVDHINHDTLDNQQTNLRIVTHRQNQENRRNQSQYGVGVFVNHHSKIRPFVAHVGFNGKYHHIGCFATAKAAQLARKQWLQQNKEKLKIQ